MASDNDNLTDLLMILRNHEGGVNVSAEPAKPKDSTRRAFLKQSGIALGGIVVGGAIGGTLLRPKPKVETKIETKVQEKIVEKPVEKVVEKTVEKIVPQPVYYNQALMYFNLEQFAIAEAAAERIFPQDDLGPGAKELGAAFYIDHQLAGAWGNNSRDYMVGPFPKAEPTQGMQTKLTRKEIFALGLQALQDYSQQKYKKPFAELSAAEQDDVLKIFEAGEEVKVEGTSATAFFGLLRTATMEGIYSDPMYGGNKDMQGWKLKRYPGNQPSYFNDIEKDGFIVMEPMSLHDHMDH
jgi:gluconate 2-dehydrogenase gamma chain